jgi:3-oxoacyl-[acyl-carrier protein] reductase
MEHNTVLVTGSSRGIGAAIVRELARYGYQPVINYHHSAEKASSLQKEILDQYGITCPVIQADVSREEEVDRMVSRIEQECGGVDILINNAGIDLSNLFQLKTADEFRRTLDVNVVGAYNCAMRVYRHMKEQNYGRIINISSTNGINTYYPMSIDYDASKAAMNSLTHDLAVQMSPEVHVNAIAPGFIGTASELEGYDEAFLKEECGKILVRRYGKPEEVAHLVRFLISEEADFINNAIIRIDGGQTGSC